MTPLTYRKLRAPPEDGAALIDPPLSQVAALVESNRAKLAEFDRRAGFPSGFRFAARVGVFASAEWSPPLNKPVLMAGHQPTLFHPGVWFKNFLLSSIAQHVGAHAVNMIADSDTIRTASIRVPTGSAVEDVPFDVGGDEIPWEERRIIDLAAFRRFPTELQRALNGGRDSNRSAKALLALRLWPKAIACSQERQRKRVEQGHRLAAHGVEPPRGWSPEFAMLGETLACGRHEIERELGLATHEFALSGVDFSLGFFVFVARILGEHRELHQIHNTVLAEYRLVNHVRSHGHPVADLVRDGDCYELPFWLWTASQPRRRRAFVRQVGQELELTDRSSIACRLPDSALDDPSDLWQRIVCQGIKLRPRALVTTMYARLVLSDLFIHGIGGAKYDELTDAIIRRFFGIEPPGYLTATATFRLPIERPQVSSEDVRDVAHRIRELRYRPESFVNDPLLAREPAIKGALHALAEEKRNYLLSHRLRRSSRDVFAGLDRLNRAMHDLLGPVEEHLRRAQARLVEEARRARLLGSREFSFVLFPEDYLVPRLLELSKLPA